MVNNNNNKLISLNLMNLIINMKRLDPYDLIYECLFKLSENILAIKDHTIL